MAQSIPSKTCDLEDLRRYLEEGMSRTEEANVECHLCECGTCQLAIANMAADETFWNEVRQALVWQEGTKVPKLKNLNLSFFLELPD